MLITLRGGELRHWQAGKGLSAPLSGVPDVWAHGQGGLLDVVLAPDFAQSRRIWLVIPKLAMMAKPELLWVMAA